MDTYEVLIMVIIDPYDHKIYRQNGRCVYLIN